MIMMCNKIHRKVIGLIILFIGLSIDGNPVRAQVAETPIGNLENGKYQFCSEPNPNDWRDGAGVCLNFAKAEDRIDGYYGYPHSDVFICIRGSSLNNTITGRALGVSWSSSEPGEFPPNRLEWDVEKRLRLGRGKVIRSIGDRDDRTDWISFQDAWLNVKGLYRYTTPKMTPASKLCDWSIVKAPG
jgi:hypothetical protein